MSLRRHLPTTGTEIPVCDPTNFADGYQIGPCDAYLPTSNSKYRRDAKTFEQDQYKRLVTSPSLSRAGSLEGGRNDSAIDISSCVLETPHKGTRRRSPGPFQRPPTTRPPSYLLDTDNTHRMESRGYDSTSSFISGNNHPQSPIGDNQGRLRSSRPLPPLPKGSNNIPIGSNISCETQEDFSEKSAVDSRSFVSLNPPTRSLLRSGPPPLVPPIKANVQATLVNGVGEYTDTPDQRWFEEESCLPSSLPPTISEGIDQIYGFSPLMWLETHTSSSSPNLSNEFDCHGVRSRFSEISRLEARESLHRLVTSGNRPSPSRLRFEKMFGADDEKSWAVVVESSGQIELPLTYGKPLMNILAEYPSTRRDFSPSERPPDPSPNDRYDSRRLTSPHNAPRINSLYTRSPLSFRDTTPRPISVNIPPLCLRARRLDESNFPPTITYPPEHQNGPYVKKPLQPCFPYIPPTREVSTQPPSPLHHRNLLYPFDASPAGVPLQFQSMQSIEKYAPSHITVSEPMKCSKPSEEPGNTSRLLEIRNYLLDVFQDLPKYRKFLTYRDEAAQSLLNLLQTVSPI